MAKRIITDNMIKDYCGEMHQNDPDSRSITIHTLILHNAFIHILLLLRQWCSVYRSILAASLMFRLPLLYSIGTSRC